MEELTTCVDAVELRMDLRAPGDEDSAVPYVPTVAYVLDQIATLGHVTSLPLIFTMRTVAQGGAFPDDRPDRTFELQELPVHVGADFFGVDIS